MREGLNFLRSRVSAVSHIIYRSRKRVRVLTFSAPELDTAQLKIAWDVEMAFRISHIGGSTNSPALHCFLQLKITTKIVAGLRVVHSVFYAWSLKLYLTRRQNLFMSLSLRFVSIFFRRSNHPPVTFYLHSFNLSSETVFKISQTVAEMFWNQYFMNSLNVNHRTSSGVSMKYHDGDFCVIFSLCVSFFVCLVQSLSFQRELQIRRERHPRRLWFSVIFWSMQHSTQKNGSINVNLDMTEFITR